MSDRFEELRRERAARAPFASSFAVRAEAVDGSKRVDLASQFAFRAEEKKGPAEEESSEEELASAEESKESGRQLVGSTGNLHRIYEGTVVQTVLANSLDGSFTGPVLCVVSKDLRSETGALLIPKGSRFIGKASRVEAQNQVRLLVTLKRLIMPNGYSVDLEAAPGLESAGETGLKDKVNNHKVRNLAFLDH